MRKPCLECVLKHLGAAAVYIDEVQMGYPNYFGFVYGQLDHAASECIDSMPALAWAIREHRIMWANTRRSLKPHRIPFEALFDYIDTVEEIGEEVEPPSEIYSGLPTGEDGKPIFSMDTRPDTDYEDSPVIVDADKLTPEDLAEGVPCPCHDKSDREYGTEVDMKKVLAISEGSEHADRMPPAITPDMVGGETAEDVLPLNHSTPN